MKNLYLIKAGTTFPAIQQKYGDFDRWTSEALGETEVPIRVIDVEQMGELPAANDCAGVTITGSHAMVTDNLGWSLRLETWLSGLVAAEVPVFGICYGHQLMARATGGRVDYHPQGKEIGSVQVSRLPASDDDPLFKTLPRDFSVHATHAQSVLTLPTGAVRLAANEFEPNHAFRLGRCAWGVQFHPEYDVRIMRSYVEEQAEALEAAGRNVPEILKTVTETPIAKQLYRNFTRYVEERLKV